MTWTEIGAFIGSATGLFVLLDRTVLGRPLVSWVRRGSQMRDLQCLNTSKSNIIIRRVRIRPANRVRVLRDTSVRGAIGSAADEPFNVLIEPGKTGEFPVALQDSSLSDDGAPRAPFVIVMSWRRTASMWFPQVPVFVFSSARTLRAIDKAKTTS
jgi:hypothetical protein